MSEEPFGPPPETNDKLDNEVMHAAARVLNRLNSGPAMDAYNASLYEDVVLENSENAYLATHDAMTGLYNRQGFETKVAEMRTQHPDFEIGILFIDLDKFKEVNDTFNHTFGDKLLKYTAKWLQKTVRHENNRDGDIICRDGGDEFVVAVLLDPNALDKESKPISPAKQLTKIHKRLFDTFASEAIEDNPRIAEIEDIGMSVGAIIWESDMTFAEAKEAADRRMYMEKAGKKRAQT